MADRRRSFGPVVLPGLGSAALAAWAGRHDWAQPSGSNNGPNQIGETVVAASADATQPLVTSLSLVVLAAWGVLLVTRGRARRVVSVLLAVAAASLAVAAVWSWASAESNLDDLLADNDVRSAAARTVWSWIGVVASLVAAATAALAVRLVPTWPEMGSRYDAPGAAPRPEDRTSIDLWRALDEGRDPTLPEERRPDP
jgi:uncharacterized membrane protein (TIGR02234 family)